MQGAYAPNPPRVRGLVSGCLMLTSRWRGSSGSCRPHRQRHGVAASSVGPKTQGDEPPIAVGNRLKGAASVVDTPMARNRETGAMGEDTLKRDPPEIEVEL